MKREDLNNLLELLKEFKEEVEPKEHLSYLNDSLKSIIWDVDNYMFQEDCSEVFEEVTKDMGF